LTTDCWDKPQGITRAVAIANMTLVGLVDPDSVGAAAQPAAAQPTQPDH
jgi:hypothetical protein